MSEEQVTNGEDKTSEGTFDFDSAFTKVVEEAGIKLDATGDSIEEESVNKDTKDIASEGSSEEGVGDGGEVSSAGTENAEGMEESDDTPSAEEKAVEEGQKSAQSKQVVSFWDGEKELKIPETSSLEVKIDGKPEKISLQDLRSSYSSKKVRDRDFQEARRLKTEAEQERNYLTGRLTELQKGVKGGNPLQALGDILEVAGVDPIEVIRGIRNNLVENAREYLSLTEEQRQFLDTKEELEYNRGKLERIQKNQVSEKDRNVMLERVQKVIESNKIPDIETFSETYRELEQLQKAGRLSAHVEKLTPELVGDYFESKTVGMMLTEAIKGEGLESSLTQEEISKLYQVVVSFKPSKEELTQTLRDLYGSERIDEATRNLNEKVSNKAKTRTTSSALASNSKKQTKTDSGSRLDPKLNWDLV